MLWGTNHAGRYMGSLMIAGATAAALVLWYVLCTGQPIRRKFAVMAAALVAVVGLRAATRWEDSIDGTALPRLVWAWAPEKGADIEPLAPTTNEVTGALDVVAEFCGPGRDGVIPERAFAVDWDSSPPVELWRRPMGLGWSSFAVARGRAVTMEQRGPDELVSCYDLLSGEPLWSHERATRFSERMGGDGPRGTPTIDGEHVFALGANGHLDCLGLTDGEPRWSVTLEMPKPLMYGKAIAPLVVDGLVVVSGGLEGPTLFAFDRGSGAPVWQAGDGKSSYASPVVCELAGRRQIVSVNGESVSGHNISTGAILWQHPWPEVWPKCAQPIPLADGGLLCTASYGAGSMVLEFTRELAVRERWKKNQLKTKFSSALVVDDYAYALDEGIFCCVELATGEKVWKAGRYRFGQNLLVEDTILIQAEKGDVVLVDPDPEGLREIARIPALNSKTWNTPAVAGRYLLVRNDTEAVCFELPVRP